MKLSSAFILLASVATALAAMVDGPCASGPGVCISTSSCQAGGGVSTTGLCPNTPDDIKCCTKAPCGDHGECQFTSTCTGDLFYATGLCPGPSNFKCCMPCVRVPETRRGEESGELDKRLPVCPE
ncbi:hypothetical protein C8R45DRAFT_916396 [Mycena sanguinolenta]|nr:hypothetical protein C8R45DRAFT_916396 [Mycena sanguinolenta]